MKKNFLTSESTFLEYSFAMSVYKGEKAKYFNQALKSILNQTYKPFDLSLVVDGPVQGNILKCIKDNQTEFEQSNISFNVIYLRENKGRGIARNLAIKNTKKDIIAILDSDDFAIPKRIEKQISLLKKSNDISIVCSFGYESDFEDPCEELKKTNLKKCPKLNKDIVKVLPFICPIINPSILFYKSAWEDVSGYPDLKNCSEDYLFFLKLAKAGYKFECIEEPLILIRYNNKMKMRRNGFKPIIDDIKFRHYSYKNKLCGFFPTMIGISISIIRRLLPAKVNYMITKMGRFIILLINKSC